MKVILTIEAADGPLSYVEAEDETYEAALLSARAQVPEGSKAIVIRTARAGE